MSGICDTCRREPCHMRFDGCKTCDVYEGGETRYEQLFGTPERAARTLQDMCDGSENCKDLRCPALQDTEAQCGNYNLLLEWLKGDA